MSKKKTLTIAVSVALVLSLAIAGTIAFLTARDSVTNTFTVGKIGLTLDEAKVNTDGKPVNANGAVLDSVADAPRVKGNEYHLIPARVYTKDPTVTITAGSEEAYVRMLVSINKLSALDAIFAPSGADLISIFGEYDAEKWLYVGETEANDVITYEFRYFQTVDASSSAQNVALEPLFTTISLPGEVTGDQLASLYTSPDDRLEIDVVAHAIQSVGFDSEDEAWESFDQQYPDQA